MHLAYWPLGFGRSQDCRRRMKISVVMACLNSEATIDRAIESFLEQDHSPKELVVVDGGSNDATLDIVRRFADPQIRIHSQTDRGIYDAMNRGLGLYSGDAVGFLNSDDRFHDRSVLGEIAGALENSDAVYGDLIFWKNDNQRYRTWIAGPYRKGIFRLGWMPPHPTFY